MLKGIILITGGAGFLGRGIMRRARDENWPCRFLVYSRDEQKHVAARRKYPDARYVIGDVLETGALCQAMSVCDYVIHAAAIKYIPECEAQPSEAMRVNIGGTQSVMQAARASGIKRCVIISTDKAAHPINTYGMTKALCERMVFESILYNHSAGASTSFAAVRYGNIIGSTGALWSVFKEQRFRDRYLSVTDDKMTRFFLSVDDATDLVLTAFGAPAGTVLIPQPMSINIGALAQYLSKQWELPEYALIGLRPGEKIHEDLVAEHESPHLFSSGSHWRLHGPTTVENTGRDCASTFLSSATCARMLPEEFVRIACDSEAV